MVPVSCPTIVGAALRTARGPRLRSPPRRPRCASLDRRLRRRNAFGSSARASSTRQAKPGAGSRWSRNESGRPGSNQRRPAWEEQRPGSVGRGARLYITNLDNRHHEERAKTSTIARVTEALDRAGDSESHPPESNRRPTDYEGLRRTVHCPSARISLRSGAHGWRDAGGYRTALPQGRCAAEDSGRGSEASNPDRPVWSAQGDQDRLHWGGGGWGSHGGRMGLYGGARRMSLRKRLRIMRLAMFHLCVCFARSG